MADLRDNYDVTFVNTGGNVSLEIEVNDAGKANASFADLRDGIDLILQDYKPQILNAVFALRG